MLGMIFGLMFIVLMAIVVTGATISENRLERKQLAARAARCVVCSSNIPVVFVYKSETDMLCPGHRNQYVRISNLESEVLGD